MTMVKSNDPGNVDGKIHSHRFPGANTAIPYVNNDTEQLEADREILAVRVHHGGSLRRAAVEESKGQVEMRQARFGCGRDRPTFAVGEEAEQSGPVIFAKWAETRGALDAPGVRRTWHRGAGRRGGAHQQNRPLLPGGTVDASTCGWNLGARRPRPHTGVERQRGR